MKKRYDYPRHPLFQLWCEMRYRCINPNKDNYKYYGARGIRVCERWLVFANFVTDMGDRPPGTTLDRINRDGDYEPGNCRWASKQQQMNNMTSNRILLVDGVQMTIAEASREDRLVWAGWGWSFDPDEGFFAWTHMHKALTVTHPDRAEAARLAEEKMNAAG